MNSAYIKNSVKYLALSTFPKFFTDYSFGFDRSMLGYSKKNILKDKHGDTLTSHPIINNSDFLVFPRENTVCGWVPYIDGKTKLVIYNFFGKNYSIRRNVIVRISVCNEFGVISQKTISLPPSQTHVEDFSCSFNLKDSNKANIAVVDIHHSRINTNHGFHDGHLRFWGAYLDNEGQYTSTIHSMPMPFSKGIHKKFILSRSFSTSEQPNSSYHFSLVKNVNLLDEKIGSPPGHVIKQNKGFYGFNVITDDQGGITGVWHNARNDYRQYHPSDSPHKVIEIVVENSFWIPPIKDIVTTIFIDPYETQIPTQEIQVDFYEGSDHLARLNKTIDNNCFSVSLEDIGGFRKSGIICIIKFLEEEDDFSAYAHICYEVEGIQSDLVHMNNSSASNILNNNIKNLDNGKSALKFMHFPISNKNLYQSWILVHNEDTCYGNNKFCLRIINSQGEDKNVHYFQFKEKEIIRIIDLNKLVDINTNGHYIAQIESQCANYNGAVLTYNKHTFHISAEHLTGG